MCTCVVSIAIKTISKRNHVIHENGCLTSSWTFACSTQTFTKYTTNALSVCFTVSGNEDKHTIKRFTDATYTVADYNLRTNIICGDFAEHITLEFELLRNKGQ
jgi:hypothetical protein